MRRIWTRMAAQDFMARALRSSAFTALGYGGPGTIKILIVLVLIIRTRPDLSVTLIAVIVVVLRTDDAGQGGLRPSASRASLPASSSKGRP